MKVSSCTGCRKRLQEDALNSSELFWTVGIRVKKTGSKAVLRASFPSFLLPPWFVSHRTGKREWKMGWLSLSCGYLFPRLDSEKLNLTLNNLQFI